MSSFPDSLLIRAAAIRLVLTDVDGVLTDGRLWYGPSGEELKAFDARDGMAIGMLRDCGIDVGLISGRTSRPLIARADDLAIAIRHLGVDDKSGALDAILAEGDYRLDEVAYLGDDLPDLPVLERVGLAAVPSDAIEQAAAIADYRCRAKGGAGVLRELAELVLSAKERETS